MAGLVFIALGVAIVALGVRKAIAAGRSSAVAAGMLRPIEGGQFEASGVAQVPGSDELIVIDDGSTREIFLVAVTADGLQEGDAVAIPLDADVTDLEGITSDGRHLYVVGSQSKLTGFDGDGLVRFIFDRTNRRADSVERVQGLKAWLAENVAELRGTAALAGDHVLNIEAIAWDPAGNRLLLGLRAPVVDGHALIVPVRLADPNAAFSRENLRVDGETIRLNLGGAGIRGLEFDPRANAFLLITGASLNEETLDFRLAEWDGKAESPLRDIETFSRDVKPEGITRAVLGGRTVRVLVFDIGSLTVRD